jgi:hypothetical protein
MGCRRGIYGMHAFASVSRFWLGRDWRRGDANLKNNFAFAGLPCCQTTGAWCVQGLSWLQKMLWGAMLVGSMMRALQQYQTQVDWTKSLNEPVCLMAPTWSLALRPARKLWRRGRMMLASGQWENMQRCPARKERLWRLLWQQKEQVQLRRKLLLPIWNMCRRPVLHCAKVWCATEVYLAKKRSDTSCAKSRSG